MSSDEMAVDFEAKKVRFGGEDTGWLRINEVDLSSEEIAALVRTGTGRGFFTLHYNRDSGLLTKTTNTVYQPGNLVGLEYVLPVLLI